MEENQKPEITETEKTEKTTKTAEPKQEKQNWFKAHLKVCVAAALILIVVVAAVIVILNQQNGNPEEVLKTYIEAMKDSDADKIMSITDVKGAYAWKECDKDASKFMEKYNEIKDEDVQKYNDEIKSELDSTMTMLKAFGGVELTLENIEKPEKLDNNLYKVKGQVKMKLFGTENNQDINLVTYNGKYIGEMSE